MPPFPNDKDPRLRYKIPVALFSEGQRRVHANVFELVGTSR